MRARTLDSASTQLALAVALTACGSDDESGIEGMGDMSDCGSNSSSDSSTADTAAELSLS